MDFKDLIDASTKEDFVQWCQKQDEIERNRVLSAKKLFDITDPLSYEKIWRKINEKKSEKEKNSDFVYGTSFYSNIEDSLVSIAKYEGSVTSPLKDCLFPIEAYYYMGVTIELMHGQGVCAFIYDHDKKLIHSFG